MLFPPSSWWRARPPGRLRFQAAHPTPSTAVSWVLRFLFFFAAGRLGPSLAAPLSVLEGHVCVAGSPWSRRSAEIRCCKYLEGSDDGRLHGARDRGGEFWNPPLGTRACCSVFYAREAVSSLNRWRGAAQPSLAPFSREESLRLPALAVRVERACQGLRRS